MTANLGGVLSRRSRAQLVALLKVQAKLSLREPYALGAGVGLPVILLVAFGFISKNVPGNVGGSGRTVIDLYIPVIMVISFIGIAVSLPNTLVRDREIGWLRRISTTPVHPSQLLGAQLILDLVLAAAAVVIAIVGGTVIFGAPLTVNVPFFILSVALAIAEIFSLGLVVVAMVSTQTAASVVSGVLFFALIRTSARTGKAMSPRASASTPCFSFAGPDEWRGLTVPPASGCLDPVDDLSRRLGVRAVEGSPLEDRLYGLGHIHPTAAYGCVERHHSVLHEPLDQFRCAVSLEVVPDQQDSERRQFLRERHKKREPLLPALPSPAVLGRIQTDGLRQRGENALKLTFEPRMKNGVGRAQNTLHPDLPSCGMESVSCLAVPFRIYSCG